LSLDDNSLDAAVRASHDEAQAAVDQETGGPVLRIGERAWFGPVVSPIPVQRRPRRRQRGPGAAGQTVRTIFPSTRRSSICVNASAAFSSE